MRPVCTDAGPVHMHGRHTYRASPCTQPWAANAGGAGPGSCNNSHDGQVELQESEVHLGVETRDLAKIGRPPPPQIPSAEAMALHMGWGRLEIPYSATLGALEGGGVSRPTLHLPSWQKCSELSQQPPTCNLFLQWACGHPRCRSVELFRLCVATQVRLCCPPRGGCVLSS